MAGRKMLWILLATLTCTNRANPNNSRSFYGDGRSAASTSLQQQHSNSKKTLYTTAMSSRADSTTSASTLLLAVY